MPIFWLPIIGSGPHSVGEMPEDLRNDEVRMKNCICYSSCEAFMCVFRFFCRRRLMHFSINCFSYRVIWFDTCCLICVAASRRVIWCDLLIPGVTWHDLLIPGVTWHDILIPDLWFDVSHSVETTCDLTWPTHSSHSRRVTWLVLFILRLQGQKPFWKNTHMHLIVLVVFSLATVCFCATSRL